MGDHLALLVDRLLTESTLQAAIENRKQAQFGPELPFSMDARNELTQGRNIRAGASSGKLVECRICQEEDEDCNMEIPCSCSGSLKYAHRTCVQRWCNEKGDVMCEICLQQFKPGYTAPPKLFHYGSIPMNFRGSWAISRQNLHDSQIITMLPSDRDFSGPEDEDYSTSSTRNMIYCRSVAVIFILLLVLRHTLPVILSGAEEYSFTLLALLVLRITGILVPVFVMVRALSTLHRGRQHRTHEETISAPEGDTAHLQPQPHLIRIH